MSKTRIKYICSNCGYESLRWLGKCPECESWNSFTEEIIETSKRKPTISKSKFVLNTIDTIAANEGDRIKTGIAEFDRVLGGGLMQGSVILLGGDPGITAKKNNRTLHQSAAKHSIEFCYSCFYSISLICSNCIDGIQNKF